MLPAVAMGLALLALGLLVARVAGAVGGVATAALTGILFPVLHTARATYSEPLAMLTLTAGLLAATLAVAAGREAAAGAGERDAGALPVRREGGGTAAGSWATPPRRGGRGPGAAALARRADASARAGLLAGLLVGGTGLCGSTRCARSCCCCRWWPWVRRSGRGGPDRCSSGWRCRSGVGGGGGGAVVAVPRVDRGEPVPLLALGVLVGGASWVALVLWRRGWRLPEVVARRLPDVAAGAGRARRPVPREPAALAGRAPGPGRPRGSLRRRDAGPAGAAGRRRAHLRRADGGLAVLVRRAGRAGRGARGARRARAPAVLSAGERRVEAGCPALVVAAGSTLLTLVRPGITPDHPWADRRLLVALPLVVALVVVGLAGWFVAPRRRARWLGATVAGVVAALVVVPAVVATWPHRGGGVERGSLAAVESVCDALSPGDVVLAVDSRAANEWPQVVRGMCGVPALSLTSRVRSDESCAVDRRRLAAGVEERGGRLVLLAADSARRSRRSASRRRRSPRWPCARTSTSSRAARAHRPAADRRLAGPRSVADRGRHRRSNARRQRAKGWARRRTAAYVGRSTATTIPGLSDRGP